MITSDITGRRLGALLNDAFAGDYGAFGDYRRECNRGVVIMQSMDELQHRRTLHMHIYVDASAAIYVKQGGELLESEAFDSLKVAAWAYRAASYLVAVSDSASVDAFDMIFSFASDWSKCDD